MTDAQTNHGVDMQRAPQRRQGRPKKSEAAAGNPASGKRPNYGTFHEAWKNVPELRRYTQQSGVPRIGMSGADVMKAQELISEYQNG